MRLPMMYAIRFSALRPKSVLASELNPGAMKVFWVKFTEKDWEPVEQFEPDCLVDKQMAEAWLRNSSDTRYRLWKVKLTANNEMVEGQHKENE